MSPADVLVIPHLICGTVIDLSAEKGMGGSSACRISSDPKQWFGHPDVVDSTAGP